MTKPLDQQIREFSLDPERTLECLAMLKVGREKGDDAHKIMSHLIASVLLRFHKIPIQPRDS